LLLSITVAPAFNSSLVVSRPGSYYSVAVKDGAASFFSTSALKVSLGNTTGGGTINVTLPQPVQAVVTCNRTKLAGSASAASKAGIGVATSCNLTVIMALADGTFKDLSADSRTVFAVVAGSSLASVSGRVLQAASNATPGDVTVQVSFVNYLLAASLSNTTIVPIVDVLGGLSLSRGHAPLCAAVPVHLGLWVNDRGLGRHPH
jgi:hypothetical protein